MELRIILFAHILGICFGLREVRIQIPKAVKKGDTAILNCMYDTEGVPLYAVKWYKGAREFYRYAPKDIPIVKTFPIGNLTVNKNESDANELVLTKVSLDAAGLYSCEVSVDAPSFHTATVEGTMNVVELPLERQTIHGLKRKYRLGEPLRANCTSSKSKPAANLTWHINGHKPQQSYVKTYTSLDTNDLQWQTSQIGLQFLVTPEHFVNGKLKIRCSAWIYDIYWQSTEVSAEEDRPKVIHFEPAATIVGINYLQPPPNFQTGQRKPDGQVDVKVIGSSQEGLRPALQLFSSLLLIFMFLSVQ